MLKHILFFLGIFSWVYAGFGQNIEPQNGVYQDNETLYAITNVDIQVSGDSRIENATLLFKNGKILKIGRLIAIPKGAVKINRKGYTLYPSFIEPYSHLGVPAPVNKHKGNRPQLSSLKLGPYYWNESIHPEVNAVGLIKSVSASTKKKWIKQGYGTISAHQKDGIMRGTSTAYTLGAGRFKSEVIAAAAANHYAFTKGISKQTYPSSQMGMIALMRQFFYDLKWYRALKDQPGDNLSFKAVITHATLPHIFEVTDKLEIFRVLKIGQEFDMAFTVFGDGHAYERVNALKGKVDQIIVPLNFPQPFDMTDPFLSRFVKLSDLKHWELAPYNPYLLSQSGIDVIFSGYRNKSKDKILTQIRKTVAHGLSKSLALKALTEYPATLLGINDKVGDLTVGKLANFIVVKGDVFEDGKIYENWIRGKQYIIESTEVVPLAGHYHFNIDSAVYDVEIKGDGPKKSGQLVYMVDEKDSISGATKRDTVKAKMNIKLQGVQFSGIVEMSHKGTAGIVQLNGTFHPKIGVIEGNGLLANGDWVKWSGIKHKGTAIKKKKDKAVVDTSALARQYFPNMAYGFDSLPEQGTYFIKNATLWTNEAEGIVKNGNLLVRNGKIVAMNKRVNAYPNNTIVIDAQGKHVTCGIIDEHSHIAISKGVNESGQSISAEVSIGDVVRSDDINIYRQLSGGVTCAQLLHGSANPIGGQSALIKLKWGYAPHDMLIKNAPGFIKFALGENVKQANWGDHNTIRFPQTRMGVEQVFYDAFFRAKAYGEAMAKYKKLSPKLKAQTEEPRRDLELDIILEIINSERFVTCHSYIQSEINMLMHVADSIGFTLNTFTHILEGYKVADKMKAHGAGASTFADWWAYKFEVNEAIPFNAAILDKMGIITAINSDDAEMGRRLNQEAAKAVKYGGVSEEAAWKMVTLNPAKLLHVDDRMGSLKTGKDADIVIWSDNPLSVNAKVEQVFVDGTLLYDQNRNEALYKRDQLERKRLIGLMLAAQKSGQRTVQPKLKAERHYHCDTMGE